jgi:hypothetical protein
MLTLLISQCTAYKTSKKEQKSKYGTITDGSTKESNINLHDDDDYCCIQESSQGTSKHATHSDMELTFLFPVQPK